MKKPGKIYILRNSSLKKTIIKIGRTKRDSEHRAKEISNSTGVPTDYEVLYEHDVFDDVLAEKRIHAKLEKSRVNPKREFFDLKLKEAVEVVFKTCTYLNKKEGSKVAILLDMSEIDDSKLSVIKSILQKCKKKTSPVYLMVQTNEHKVVQILVGDDLFADFTPELVSSLIQIVGLNGITWQKINIKKNGDVEDNSEFIDIDWDN